VVLHFSHCHILRQHSHVHYVELVTVHVNGMWQTIFDIDQENFSNGIQLKLNSVDTSTNFLVHESGTVAGFEGFCVAEHVFVDFVEVLKEREGWVDEGNVVDHSDEADADSGGCD
jgi:hypothetical protein